MFQEIGDLWSQIIILDQSQVYPLHLSRTTTESTGSQTE